MQLLPPKTNRRGHKQTRRKLRQQLHERMGLSVMGVTNFCSIWSPRIHDKYQPIPYQLCNIIYLVTFWTGFLFTILPVSAGF
jgi:hypothetical protein